MAETKQMEEVIEFERLVRCHEIFGERGPHSKNLTKARDRMRVIVNSHALLVEVVSKYLAGRHGSDDLRAEAEAALQAAKQGR